MNRRDLLWAAAAAAISPVVRAAAGGRYVTSLQPLPSCEETEKLIVPALRAALGWAGDSGRAPARTSGDGLILGCEPNERSLRFGLERGYRALARLTSDRSRRIELVDMANAVRPKTWS